MSEQNEQPRPRLDNDKLHNTIAAMRGVCEVKRGNKLVQAALEAALDGLYDLLEERAVAAQDVQEIPSPPLGRELGRSPIPTPRRQEREALLSIVQASCEVDTVRKAALALLGEVAR